jgi:tripartite-type tricarboxylate transporter receptor subunit TctC
MRTANGFCRAPAEPDYIRDGKLRALAVTTATRSEVLPNVPVSTTTVSDGKIRKCSCFLCQEN